MLDAWKNARLYGNMDARIRVVIHAASAMLGYSPAELVVAALRQITGGDGGDGRDGGDSTGKLLNSSGVLEQMMVWRGANDARIDVLASSSFVRDSDGA